MGCQYNATIFDAEPDDMFSYVWGDTWEKAKTQCERYVQDTTIRACVTTCLLTYYYSLDYIFQLAVEMRKLNLPWVDGSNIGSRNVRAW